MPGWKLKVTVGKARPELKVAVIVSLLAMALSIIGLKSVLARNVEATPDSYAATVRALQPGDTLKLIPGTYTKGLRIHDLVGSPERLIIIEGPLQAPFARFVAQAGANTVSLANAAFIVIRNLSLDGRNIPVDAVKAEGSSQFTHDITLEGLHITGYGNNQQTVGISTKCPSWNWIIRRNVIEEAGTGIYLGNSNGSAPFWAGIIEDNRVIDSIGYDLQIKHQRPRPYIEGAPANPSVTIIRNNLFGKSRNASAGNMARPNVLLGHWPLAGPGKDDRYLVYGNYFVDNPAEALFQAEGRLALYNNVFINPWGDGVHIQPHNDIPRDMVIFYNTFVVRDAGIVIRHKPSWNSFSQKVLANVIAAGRSIQGGEAAYDVTLPFKESLDKPYPATRLTTLLMAGKQKEHAVPKAVWASFASHPDWNRGRPDPSLPGAMGEDPEKLLGAYLLRR